DIFLLVITFFFLFLIGRLLFSIENIKYLSNKILLLIFLVLGFGFCRYFVINRVQDFYNLQLPLIVVANSTIVCTTPFLFYLYVRTVLYDQKSFVKNDLIHLFVLVCFYIIYEFPYSTDLYSGQEDNPDYLFWSTYFRANYFPDWVSGSRSLLSIVYSFLTYRLLYKYFKSKSPSKQLKTIKKWLYSLTHIKLALTVLIVVFTVLFTFLDRKSALSVESSMIIVSLVFLGLAIFLNKNRNILYNIPVFMNPNNLSTQKIIEQVNLGELFTRLNHEIKTQELYLDNQFNLSWLSATLDIKAKHISLAISENGFENFSAYSNYFRIEKAKELIKLGYLEDFSIDALASASGFKAVNSFYRIFKSVTGKTPSKYSEGAA
ncbi:helix-turn-helix domain-containing protein, partial [Flavobacteriaceae bacterium]|nr:helix-turn-helix domain-containing protein [Flavobacteriaceae bacterium]